MARFKAKLSSEQPACFDSDASWSDWKRLANRSGMRQNYCTDCLPEYKAKMVEQGRCGWQKVAFKHKSAQGGGVEIVGRRYP